MTFFTDDVTDIAFVEATGFWVLFLNCKALKDAKEQTEQAILYELRNHESFYTGDIDDVVALFKGVYTRKQIKAVYQKHYSAESENI